MPSAAPSPAALASPQAPRAPAVTQVEFDHFEGQKIIFKVPEGMSALKPISSGLFELSYLGALRGEDKDLPYFLFAGRSCAHCDEDKALYIIRADGKGSSRFVYPGKILDPKTRALLFESQSFYGHCLPGHGEAYVVFQRERIDRRRSLQPSVFVAEPGSDHLDETLIERRIPRIKRTLQLVKHKLCHPIEGRNREMTLKRLNLRPRDASERDDEEEDDAPKENQTDRDFHDSPKAP